MSSAALPAAIPSPVSASVERNRRATLIAGAICLAVVAFALLLIRFWQRSFAFDDAYMYSRYALNFRHGGGIAWNMGGGHTFGITSLPWFFVVLAGSFFCADPSWLLPTASCLTGLGAMLVLTILINRSTRSVFLQRFVFVFPVIVLSLLLNARFAYGWSNGMETMLGMLSVTLFLLAHGHFCLRLNATAALVLAAAGALCTFTRPELLLLVLSLPVLQAWLQQKRDDRRHFFGRLLTFYAALFLFLGAGLIGNQLYFGTPVPLAFYVKSMHGYDGYRLFQNSPGQTATFLSIGIAALLLITVTAQHRHRAMLLTYLLPAALVCAYLMTVIQIMGIQARYYLPLLPMLFFPAALLLDDVLAVGDPLRFTPGRAVALLGVCLLSKDCTGPLTSKLGFAVSAHRTFYAEPVFTTPAALHLPWVDGWKSSPAFVNALPAGSTVVASEVGFLGAAAPTMRIVDAAGLNDAFMARHPNNADYLLAQHAEMIWLPHPDYTLLYGRLVSNPTLLANYDLYVDALNFGLAIRKDVAQQPAVRSAIRHAWQCLYPGSNMESYRVQSVTWDPHARLVGSPADSVE